MKYRINYFCARWYDPITGRWLSKDPIGISGGLNQYQAFLSNPVNFKDPYGEDVWVVNRKLGGNEGRSQFNPVTHTFLVITDKHGNVTDTYSWGNAYVDDCKNMGWFPNEDNDIQAAEDAIRNGLAKRIGDSGYDDPLKNTFDHIKNLKKSKHKWRPWNNCKHEAANLWNNTRRSVK